MMLSLNIVDASVDHFSCHIGHLSQVLLRMMMKLKAVHALLPSVVCSADACAAECSINLRTVVLLFIIFEVEVLVVVGSLTCICQSYCKWCCYIMLFGMLLFSVEAIDACGRR